MFGQPDDELIANLERLRSNLCAYFPGDRCDCKFGASRKGEQTGCPEIRQAIAIISGQRDEVVVAKELFEASAASTLSHVRQIVERFYEPSDNQRRPS